MRLLNLLCRIIVGSLFIVSGLIKLNDPYGTAYKLTEYFHVFAADFGNFFLVFIPYSVPIALIICSLEVILGIAILINYRMKITMWITLLLLVFFTFLTWYSYFFNKVQDCGCFGTAIKLTPGQSFYKDVFLLALVIVLFIKRKEAAISFKGYTGDVVIAFVTLLSFGTGIYSINHLPFIDPTSYKIGNDIGALTKVKVIPEYHYVFEKDGKEYIMANWTNDSTYKYKRHFLVTDSNLLKPVIAGFRIYNDEGDFTEAAFKGKKALILIVDPSKAVKNCSKDCMKDLNTAKNILENKGFQTMILTIPPTGNSFEEYRHEVQLSGDYYFMDDGILKTMIRSNPGLILLQDGKIINKWHYNDIPNKEELNTIIN